MEDFKFDMPLSDATQYATLFTREDQAIATVQRASVMENGPAWIIYATDGKRLSSIWRSPKLEHSRNIDYLRLTQWIIRRVQNALMRGRI